MDENETWIEGVGSLAGVAHRSDPGLTGSFFSYLQCYFEDDNLVWTDGECWDDVEEVVVESVSLYPNPASGVVRIEGVEAEEVWVYNAFGQVVKRVRGTNEIPVADLPQGVYMLRVTDADGKVYTNKITVR